MSFLSRWWKGTKETAKSTQGVLQAQLIITGFIVIGCILGAWQIKNAGGFGVLSFILFAYGFLSLISFFSTLRQYRQILIQQRMFDTALKYNQEKEETK